jgi:hypothetical protein
LWTNIFKWWNTLEVPKFETWKPENIILGVTGNTDICNALNLVILYGKFYIYTCKTSENIPDLYVFLVCLKNYVKKLNIIKMRETTTKTQTFLEIIDF